MNHYELLTLIQSYQTIFTLLVDRGLLAARRQCYRGTDMVLRERSESEDGFHVQHVTVENGDQLELVPFSKILSFR